MPDLSTSPWPRELFSFAFVPEIDQNLEGLAKLAEDEDWSYQRTPSQYRHPILFNYLRYTYSRVADELKIALSGDGKECCFNTGLVTKNQEALFASFETNHVSEAQQWYFDGWYRHGQRELNQFSELPDLAHYFDDPTCLVFDGRKDLRINIEHIIGETPRERFPEPYRSMSNYALQTALMGGLSKTQRSVSDGAIRQLFRSTTKVESNCYCLCV